MRRAWQAERPTLIRIDEFADWVQAAVRLNTPARLFVVVPDALLVEAGSHR